MPLLYVSSPTQFNTDVVKMLCDNDVDGLKKLSSNGTSITFDDYLKAVDNTEGKVVLNTESIIYLHDIGVLHEHQVMLDGAMIGNVDLIKYAETKGEDLFYYKVLIYILTNPQNLAQKYVLQRMMEKGKMDNRALTDLYNKNIITVETYNDLVRFTIRKSYSKWWIVPIVTGIFLSAYYILN